MDVIIFAAIVLLIGISSVLGRQIKAAQLKMTSLESELHVLKHEMAHRDVEKIHVHSKGSTVVDDVAYQWEKYARKRLGKGWK
jgi:hypothetical protein